MQSSAVSGTNTWDRKIYAYLNTHHGKKFYRAVTDGSHNKQMKIEFVKHARQGGSKEFDVLIKISGDVVYDPPSGPFHLHLGTCCCCGKLSRKILSERTTMTSL